MNSGKDRRLMIFKFLHNLKLITKKKVYGKIKLD